MKFLDIIDKFLDEIIKYNCEENYRIESIEFDSRKVIDKTLFVAIEGNVTDGHNYIKQAKESGAKGFVVSKELDNVNELHNYILVKDSLNFMAKVAYEFYKKSIENVTLFGITGTNGKTSIANFVYGYLKTKFDVAGIIGTMEYIIGDERFEAVNTTPESKTFYELVSKTSKYSGSKAVVAEASSHALKLNRLYNVKFDVVGFTNLTRDHLDFHKDMQDYYLSKRELFVSHVKSGSIAVINIDDEYGLKLYNDKEIICKKVSVSTKDSGADLYANNIEFTEHYTNFNLVYNGKEYKSLRLNLVGEFNLFNSLVAIGMLVAQGGEIDAVLEYIQNLKPVCGRFEKVNITKKDVHVIVDYAHTPDALKNLLESVKLLANGRVITIFGAGGDRDRGKRHLMREVAEKFSDIVVITSDNPRTEDPNKIIEDILEGHKIEDYIVEVDREKAIYKALDIAKSGDWVVIAGKGHEDYQIIGHKKIHFSDQEIVRRWDVNS